MGPIKVISFGDDVPRFSFPKIVPKDQHLIVAWTYRIDDISHVRSASVPISTL
jgi:hypothetical protein